MYTCNCILLKNVRAGLTLQFKPREPCLSESSARHMRRGKRNQNNNTSLIKIDGVASKEETPFYCGKRIAYIYKAKTKRKGSKFRVIWGKVGVAHVPTTGATRRICSTLASYTQADCGSRRIPEVPGKRCPGAQAPTPELQPSLHERALTSCLGHATLLGPSAVKGACRFMCFTLAMRLAGHKTAWQCRRCARAVQEKSPTNLVGELLATATVQQSLAQLLASICLSQSRRLLLFHNATACASICIHLCVLHKLVSHHASPWLESMVWRVHSWKL